MPGRSDQVLKEASGHLFYEYDMMRRTAKELELILRERRTVENDDKVRHNAALESFLVHVRNLIVFLGWRPSGHPSDVLAKHFVVGFTSNIPTDGWLAELYDAVCTRIVHLSYERANVDPYKREWPINDIVAAVEKELERFLCLVPLHVLDERWKVPRCPVLSAQFGSTRAPTMMAETSNTNIRTSGRDDDPSGRF
jgi:hypothetical protein